MTEQNEMRRLAELRSKCAASGYHDHDGCACSDEELRRRPPYPATAGVTDEMVEAAAKATDPDLFSDDERIAHRSASPWKVEFARGKARELVRKALEAAILSTITPGTKDDRCDRSAISEQPDRERIAVLEAENYRLRKVIADLDAQNAYDDTLLRDIHLRLQIHGEKYPERMVSVLHRNVVFYKTVEAIQAALAKVDGREMVK